MEAIRPEVDAYVLNLLSSRVFAAGDFHETRQGGRRHTESEAPTPLRADPPPSSHCPQLPPSPGSCGGA
jgi:hypothetical protein